MILHLIQIQVLPKDRVNAIRTINTIVGPTKASIGCLSCSFFSDIDNDDVIVLQEKWDSMESLEKHINSNEYNNLLELIELAIETPTVEFYTLSTNSGMDLVKEKRLGK